MQPYVGDTHRTTSYFFCYDSLKSASSAEICEGSVTRGDLSHYQVPHCIRVFFYFVWIVLIHHNFQFYIELCTYCNILDIYLS